MTVDEIIKSLRLQKRDWTEKGGILSRQIWMRGFYGFDAYVVIDDNTAMSSERAIHLRHLPFADALRLRFAIWKWRKMQKECGTKHGTK